jgi:hypothetical protein
MGNTNLTLQQLSHAGPFFGGFFVILGSRRRVGIQSAWSALVIS